MIKILYQKTDNLLKSFTSKINYNNVTSLGYLVNITTTILLQ